MLGNPKIIFFGTPEFAAGILKALIENKFDIAAVVTQPDRKIGRRREIVFSPVKKITLENKIPVLQPETLTYISATRKIKEIGADLFIVAAYGKILPKEILEIPRYGAVNVHTSLLPWHRGASPVQSAILAGEKETGITLIKMNERMDEGDILAREKIKIKKNETADILSEKLGRLGADMMANFIPDWIAGKIRPIIQNHEEATYCKPVKRENGKINWDDAVEKIYRQWRAYRPWPGIFSEINLKNQSKRLKLTEIEIISGTETGEKTGKIIKYNKEIAAQARGGLIIFKKIQIEGKKEIGASDFAKGHPEIIGSILK